jgi:trans-2,3-dihydro-3-hydroxyanthranilate isomerase
MTRREYALVDVFTDTKFAGNPLAVFGDGRGIPDGTMQAIAKELNLSETVFVLPPRGDGDHELRIFTPARELPFAGHPTVGTAFFLARGRDATLRLEEKG